MKLKDFDYDYPETLVAQKPLARRDASRMMIVDRCARAWRHEHISSLPRHLEAGDMLVVNDSRVMPMRLFGELYGGKPIELLLVEMVDIADDERPEIWKCVIRRARRYRLGDVFFFGIASRARVVGHDGTYLLVEFKPGDRRRAMERHGAPPLPPYIKRGDLASYTDADRECYQTVYARHDGSAAAPTAGLHFTDELMDEMVARGVEIVSVTLHVGLDTFQPVRTDDVREHAMHGERYIVSVDAAEKINSAMRECRRIIAVGTTTVRVLESSVRGDRIAAGAGTTNLFITPGYEFHAIDGIVTNFHQPRSTLLMMIAAFAGREFTLQCYGEAIREGYRLFSFGDCMAIL